MRFIFSTRVPDIALKRLAACPQRAARGKVRLGMAWVPNDPLGDKRVGKAFHGYFHCNQRVVKWPQILSLP